MRITQEADYAIRVMIYLYKKAKLTDARTIADEIKAPARYTLKILRRLVHGGMIESRKGIHGGYKTVRIQTEISLADIIELIDGPIRLNRCLTDEYRCSLNGDSPEKCKVHNSFVEISGYLRELLKEYTLDKFL